MTQLHLKHSESVTGGWAFELAARRLRELHCTTEYYREQDRLKGLDYWRMRLCSEAGLIEHHALAALSSKASYIREVEVPPEVLASIP